jgi:hypothetical protein
MRTPVFPKALSLLLLVSAVVACASVPAGQAVQKLAPALPEAEDAAGERSYYGGSNEAVGDRMIVRTADLSLVVADAETAVSKIKDIVDGLGGYLVDSNLWRDEDQLRGSVTVRVPSDSLEDALSQFKALSVKVERERSSSQDVTEEYTDLSAQLRNLEATEEELRELLATVRQRTGKAEDILAVYRELTSIRSQIEQLKGRMQYLERTAAMSAVTLELIPDVLAQPIAGTDWRPSATVAEALRSLLRTLRFLVDAGIVLLFYVLPLVAVVLLPVVGLLFIWRRWRKSRGAS